MCVPVDESLSLLTERPLEFKRIEGIGWEIRQDFLDGFALPTTFHKGVILPFRRFVRMNATYIA